MKKELTDILREALIGKKIKLYKVSSNVDYYATSKEELIPSEQKKIVGETFGIIQDIETDTETYCGDSYDFTVVDESGSRMNMGGGLSSITSEIEIIE
jgi:hypothetical protein